MLQPDFAFWWKFCEDVYELQYQKRLFKFRRKSIQQIREFLVQCKWSDEIISAQRKKSEKAARQTISKFIKQGNLATILSVFFSSNGFPSLHIDFASAYLVSCFIYFIKAWACPIILVSCNDS